MLVFFSLLVSILRFISDDRTLARNPVLSGCSIVSGERLYLTMIEG